LVHHAFAAQNNKIQGTFLKKDDPRINTLMQQAELLSSLALKVDAENMDQSLENAWKVRLDSFRTFVSIFEHLMGFFKTELQLMSSKEKTEL